MSIVRLIVKPARGKTLELSGRVYAVNGGELVQKKKGKKGERFIGTIVSINYDKHDIYHNYDPFCDVLLSNRINNIKIKED